MKPLPGAALEVIKTEFFFELLVCLLAEPSRLDGCQGVEIGLRSGHLTVGVRLSWMGIGIGASANWSNVQYVGGSTDWIYLLKVEVFDATSQSWIISSAFKATTTTPPAITATNFSVSPSQSIAISPHSPDRNQSEWPQSHDLSGRGPLRG